MQQKISQVILISLFLCCFTCQNSADNSSTDSHQETPNEKIEEAITSLPTPNAFLDGKWQSKDDDQYYIVFAEDWAISYYGKEVTSKENWEYQTKCTDACNAIEGSCLLLKDKEEKTCYYVIKLSEQELQMSMIGGRGNTLSFSKVN